MTLTYLGPFGALREFDCLPPEIAVQGQRQSYRGITVVGRAYTQQAQQTARQWNWLLNPVTPQILYELEALQLNTYGPPPWRWYDPYAAETNMLPQGAAIPGSTYELGQLFSQQTLIPTATPSAWDGRPIGWAVDVTDELIAPALDGEVDPVPVIVGRTYTFSVSGLKITDDDWTVALRWVDADGATISESTAGIGINANPQRGVVTGTAPLTTAGVLVVVRADTADEVIESVTALQLTESDSAVDWYPGQGIPRVSIPAGIDGVLRRVRLGECDPSMRGATVTLVEVG